jgi:hypothetical protein
MFRLQESKLSKFKKKYLNINQSSEVLRVLNHFLKLLEQKIISEENHIFKVNQLQAPNSNVTCSDHLLSC